MLHDSMAMYSPAAQTELVLLKTLKIGDKRHSVLFPALEDSIEWVCVRADENRWEFDGKFLGLYLYRIRIVATEATLTLEVL